MKIDILIVDLLVVALVAVPFLFFVLKANSGKRKLKAAFRKVAENHGLKISESFSWNSNRVGLDKNHGKFLLVQLKGRESVIKLADLEYLRSVKLRVENKPSTASSRKEEALQRLDLEFIYTEGKKSQLVNLYDDKQGLFQDHELKNGERCCNFLNQYLKERTDLGKAS